MLSCGGFCRKDRRQAEGLLVLKRISPQGKAIEGEKRCHSFILLG